MEEKSKIRIYNHDELEKELMKGKEDSYDDFSIKKSKHSLDSDEEDEEEKAKKYNVLDPNDLEGQEDGTIDFDGEIKITPFNMKEEMEEGYFDKEGTYIFNKEDEVVKDQWLDDIDWVKIKAREKTKRKPSDNEDSDSEEDRPQINLIEKYTQMLELMKPTETVQKAICRLGGSSSRSASNRWKKKKQGDSANNEDGVEKDVEKCQQLTSLADKIVQSGDMDIYQQTYEMMSFRVKASAQKIEPSTEAELDMFGDEFEENVDEANEVQPKTLSPSTTEAVNDDAESEVKWEFKWESSDDAKVYGPYPSSQMQQWVDEKYFEDGILARQVGKQDARFYSSKRIDFELYI